MNIIITYIYTHRETYILVCVRERDIYFKGLAPAIWGVGTSKICKAG